MEYEDERSAQTLVTVNIACPVAIRDRYQIIHTVFPNAYLFKNVHLKQFSNFRTTKILNFEKKKQFIIPQIAIIR